MTPPRNLHNFLTGSVHSRIDAEPLDAEVLRTQDRTRSRELGEESAFAARYHARSHFLFTHGDQYGGRDIAPVYAELSLADLEAGIATWSNEARNGYRRRFFDSLRANYALLLRCDIEDRAEIVRDILTLTHDYQSYLYAAPLSTQDKFRYLFAASRSLQAVLGFVHQHAPLVSDPRNGLEGELAEALHNIDLELEIYHRAIPEESVPPGFDVIHAYSRLREALLRDPVAADERERSFELENRFADFRPLDTDRSWTAMHTRSFREDPEFNNRLVAFDQPSPAELESFQLSCMALDLIVSAAFTLDRVREESEAVLNEEYRAFTLVMTGLMRLQNEWPLDEVLEMLADPAFLENQSELLQNSLEQFPELHELFADQNIPAMMAQAQQRAQHILELRENFGRQILDPLMNLSRSYHPIHRLCEFLGEGPRWVAELELPAAHLRFYSALAGQAVELFRRESTAISQLESIEAVSPGSVRPGVFELLRSQGNHAGTNAFLRDFLEAMQTESIALEDHELLALQSSLQALESNRESYESIGVSEEMFASQGQLAASLDGWELRTRRSLSQLFSASNLIGIGAGILVSEIFPSLLVLRAGLGGRLRVPVLGTLVNGGILTTRGAAVSGLTTGLAMSGMGSLLHNAERERMGLPTHRMSDVLYGAALNGITFAATLPFSRQLQNLLARRAELRTGTSRIGAAANLFHHGATVAFASSASLGLGVLLRGAQTGQFYTSFEEVLENFGSVLLWEGGSAGFRLLRRQVGIPIELSGVYHPLPEPSSGPTTMTRHFARRFDRGLSQFFFSNIGPHRLTLAVSVKNQLIRFPGLENESGRLLQALVHQEARTPGSLRFLSSRLELGFRPEFRTVGGHATVLVSRPDSNPPPPIEPSRTGSTTPIVATTVEILAPIAPARQVTSELDGGYYFSAALPKEPGDFGLVRLIPKRVEPNGSVVFEIGRENFPFLSDRSRRSISRRHFELIRNASGEWVVRDLSRAADRVVPRRVDIGQSHGTHFFDGASDTGWTLISSEQGRALRSGDALTLGIPGDGVEMTFMRFQNSPEPTAIPNNHLSTAREVSGRQLFERQQIFLDSGKRAALEGLTILRDTKSSGFWVLGSGGTRLAIERRSSSETSGNPSIHDATENPRLGFIGDEVALTINPGPNERRFILELDDPQRSGTRLPEADLNYAGSTRNFRFSADTPTLNFGKLYDEGFFTADWISRHHIALGVVERGGHPRYQLTVQGRNGLRVNGELILQNESIDLRAGEHVLEFPMRPAADVFDAPMTLRLTPIEVNFKEWSLPLLPAHDRALPG